MLEKVKLALRITTDAFDDELEDLICAAKHDLGIVDIVDEAICEPDTLVGLAIITFVKMHFGQPDEYERLKRSYDEQKAQLITSSQYTEWK